MIGVDRIPPSSLEAEMAAIGSVLVEREMFDLVAALVRPADFYAHVHDTIFRAIEELHNSDRPTDKITLAEYLRDHGQLDNVGGFAYLTRLMDSVPTAASAEYYATIVREKADLRGLIHAGSELARIGFEGETDVKAAIAEAETAFQRAIDRGQSRGGGTPLREVLVANYEDLLRRIHGEVKNEGQYTPWKGVNDLIGSVLPGEMIVWAAGAKSGKTAALTMLADYIAAKYGPVAAFVLEMGKKAMAMRYGALYGGVSAKRQRDGDLSEREMDRLSAGCSTLMERPIQLYDLNECSRLAEMRRELRMFVRERGSIAAVVVDPVNFIADSDASRNDRTTKNDRLDVIYRTLLRFAKEFNCVMHVVQHVNREGMDGPPRLKDIRDGGNPEGHAHAVINPYRPKPNGTIEERAEGQMRVLATREGEAGAAPMQFVGYRGLWLDRDAARAWWEPAPAEESDIFAGAL